MAFQPLYDEDLSENKFFEKLQNEHKILIDTAPLENWIVCVPRAATIKPEHLANTDYLLAHILIPHDEIPEQYTNLLGADVKQFNGKLHVRSTSSTILFEEIFYTKGLLKYKVWCIEWPLLCGSLDDGTVDTTTDDETLNGIFIVRGLQDAIALIWAETNSKAVFRKIESICCSFMKSTNYLPCETACEYGAASENNPTAVKRIKNSVEILLNHCFKKLLYQRRLYDKCSTDPHFRRVFKFALETYIMDILYRWLFDAVTIAYADENEKFNRTIRNLSDATVKDFKIDGKYNDVIGRVRIEMIKINDFTTPIEKSNCLRRALSVTSQCKQKDICVDDLIPILVFTIIKSGLTHWTSTLHFLKNFIFTEFSDSSDKGVDSFLITTMEAAIAYIQSIDLKEFKLNAATALTMTQTNNDSAQPKRRFANKEHFVDYLFAKIRAQDEVEIIKLLKTDKNVVIVANGSINNSDDSINEISDCLDNVITINGNGTAAVNDDDIDEGVADEIVCRFPLSRLNLQNVHGIGAIHVAAMHGLPKMLNLLLALGVDLHIKDENNYTPLHYAAARGEQSVLLLLLHAGADINALTADKNTALHLSSLNGHSNCVKALLYYCDHMKVKIDRNSQNKFGDTALHLACKWGFREIVETLLEYGVKTNLKNRLAQSALDYAHNSQIALLLQNAFDVIESHENGYDEQSFHVGHSTDDDRQEQLFRGCFTSSLSNSIDKVDSAALAQKTCNDKIVAAIKNEDTKLACHFLGIDIPDDVSKSVCHPLCDCEKCKRIADYVMQKENAAKQLKQTYRGDINECSNTEGLTPLQAAIQYKNMLLIENILAMGAKVGVQSKCTRQTAIHYATLTQSIDILNLILNHAKGDDDIDAQDVNGDTALHLAIRLGDIQLVDALLKHEPNLKIRNNDDKTPGDIAKALLQLNMVRMLELAEKSEN